LACFSCSGLTGEKAQDTAIDSIAVIPFTVYIPQLVVDGKKKKRVLHFSTNKLYHEGCTLQASRNSETSNGGMFADPSNA